MRQRITRISVGGPIAPSQPLIFPQTWSLRGIRGSYLLFSIARVSDGPHDLGLPLLLVAPLFRGADDFKRWTQKGWNRFNQLLLLGWDPGGALDLMGKYVQWGCGARLVQLTDL